jgi:hypothetical protein
MADRGETFLMSIKFYLYSREFSAAPCTMGIFDADQPAAFRPRYEIEVAPKDR